MKESEECGQSVRDRERKGWKGTKREGKKENRHQITIGHIKNVVILNQYRFASTYGYAFNAVILLGHRAEAKAHIYE